MLKASKEKRKQERKVLIETLRKHPEKLRIFEATLHAIRFRSIGQMLIGIALSILAAIVTFMAIVKMKTNDVAVISFLLGGGSGLALSVFMDGVHNWLLAESYSKIQWEVLTPHLDHLDSNDRTW